MLLIVVNLGAAPVAPAGPLELTLMAVSAEYLGKPHDIVLSPDGRLLYVADNDNATGSWSSMRTL